MKNEVNQHDWKIAGTATVNILRGLMDYAKESGVSRIFCDIPDMGKTVAAEVHCKSKPNSWYVDCSQHKYRREFILALCRASGSDDSGTFNECYADLVEHIKRIAREGGNPQFVLDEFGDLDHKALLELKALWNAVNGHDDGRMCSFFLLAADGAEKKFTRLKGKNKHGYGEIYRRFGSTILRISPMCYEERKIFIREHAKVIAALNAPGVKIDDLMKATDLESKKDGTNYHNSLDRLRDNIFKLRKAAK